MDPLFGNPGDDLAVLGAIEAEDIGWIVRITVPHVEGPFVGWAPHVFLTEAAAEAWLDGRTGTPVRPMVRRCDGDDDGLAYATLITDLGHPLFFGEPGTRAHAAAAAALFAAEFRSRQVHPA